MCRTMRLANTLIKEFPFGYNVSVHSYDQKNFKNNLEIDVLSKVNHGVFRYTDWFNCLTNMLIYLTSSMWRLFLGYVPIFVVNK